LLYVYCQIYIQTDNDGKLKGRNCQSGSRLMEIDSRKLPL